MKQRGRKLAHPVVSSWPPRALGAAEEESIRDAFLRCRKLEEHVRRAEATRFLQELPSLMAHVGKADDLNKAVVRDERHRRHHQKQTRRALEDIGESLESALQQLAAVVAATGNGYYASLDEPIRRARQSVARALALKPLFGPRRGRPTDLTRTVALYTFAKYFRRRTLPVTTAPDGLFSTVMCIVLDVGVLPHVSLQNAMADSLRSGVVILSTCMKMPPFLRQKSDHCSR
jgi:hypothetical protein